jgi:ACS family tartrate transporter-like MFS transporter
LSNLTTGFVTAIPYAAGTIGLLLWGYSSDRLKERRWHLILSTALAAVGLALAGWFSHSFWGIAAMSLFMFGVYGSRPTFWPMPSVFLTGGAAAVGMALINSIGNVGGQIGPWIVGQVKDITQSFEMALYFLAASALLSAVIAFFTRRATGAAGVSEAEGAQPARQPAQ